VIIAASVLIAEFTARNNFGGARQESVLRGYVNYVTFYNNYVTFYSPKKHNLQAVFYFLKIK